MKKETQKPEEKEQKAAAPAKHPPVPKPRDMKKIAAARLLLWLILGFVLLRGLVAILFPADVEQLAGELSGSIARVESAIIPEREAAAFAESFAREYFTYTARGNEDYQKRLEQYCGSRLAGDICEGIMLKGGATATYLSVVEVMPYSDTQQDITVLAVTEYITEEPLMVDGKETLQEVIVSASTYLTVPVYLSSSGYLVEDIPLVTSPPAAATDYQVKTFSATAADDRIKSQASTMLEDFFKTLYSEGQQRIAYYLTEDANTQRLREIKGSMQFSKLDAVELYRGSTQSSYLAVVTLRLEDRSGSPVKQRFNVTLVENGSRLYVKDINLRSHNLKE